MTSGKISEAMVEAARTIIAQGIKPSVVMGKVMVAIPDSVVREALTAALLVPAPGTGKWLGELLAVIHRDGGQYQATHGDEKAVEDAHSILAAAFAAPVGEMDGWQPTHKHVKRGSTYRVVAEGRLQTGNGHLVDMHPMTIYQGEDGAYWVRAAHEFHDGRFTALASPQGVR